MVRPAGKNYGPKDKNQYGNKYKSVNQAYDEYQKDRTADKTSPAIAPKGEFSQIYGWQEP